jgi:hypothetical protein
MALEKSKGPGGRTTARAQAPGFFPVPKNLAIPMMM